MVRKSRQSLTIQVMHGLMERERRLERLDGAIALGLADAEVGWVQEIEAVRRELHSAAAESAPAA